MILKLRKTLLLSAAIALATPFIGARADGLIQLSLIPLGYPSSGFPKAFTGFGEGAGFVYGFPGTSHAIEARVLTQGTGNLYAGLYRGYLFGRMWSVAPDIKKQDYALQVRTRTRNIYWEVGMGYFNATTDILFGTETVSGGAGVAAIGIEQPLMGVLAGLRFNIMNSIDSAVHSSSIEINFGFPIDL